MFESNNELEKVIKYMKAHWPSEVKQEWQVKLDEYPLLVQKALADLVQGATQHKEMVRIAGISGAGKTTQLLPAAEMYFAARDVKPILVAARKFVEYHPYWREIKEYYGEENLRKMTDEFSTIMMFLCMQAMVKQGYDILLDVTLLDPAIEGMLMKELNKNAYTVMILMIAVAPEVVERHLSGRKWRHTKETEQEFIRATESAMKYYAEVAPDTKIILWNTYEEEPVYDGPIKGALGAFNKYSKKTDVPEHDEGKMCEAKKRYLAEK